MIHLRKLLVTVTVLSIYGLSCTEKKPLEIPEQYISQTYNENITTELDLLEDFKQFSLALKATGTGNPVTTASLTSKYDGTGLRGATTLYYAGRIDQWLPEIAASSQDGTYDPTQTPSQNGHGGFYGNRLFDEYGLELIQLVEKGLYDAALYRHAVAIIQGKMVETDVDKLVCIIGAYPHFPNSDNSAKHSNPDRYAAKYAAQRDKNDGNGFYSQIKKALITLKAAINAGPDYDDEKVKAQMDFLQNWEKSCAATAIYYLKSAISKLSSTSPDAIMIADALHAYSEAVGFIHGWKSIPQTHRIITDSQVDLLLSLLRAPSTGTANAAHFVTAGPSGLSELGNVVNEIKVVYGFTDIQLNDFSINWVAQQNR